jgi:hypothetical protein
MIKTDTINWHFESSVLWSQRIAPSINEKLRSWENNSIEIENDISLPLQSDLNEWKLPNASIQVSSRWTACSKDGFTVSNAEEVWNILIRRDAGHDPLIGNGMTLASFLYIRPQALDLRSIENKFGHEGVKDYIARTLICSLDLIHSFFYNPQYCVILRRRNTKLGIFPFASIVFEGDVYWNESYKFPASTHPNPKLLYLDVRKRSNEITRHYLGKYLQK